MFHFCEDVFNTLVIRKTFLYFTVEKYFKQRKMKILVVDDEKDVESLFRQRFRKEINKNEVQFVFAESGEKALHYLTEHDYKADSILSDINMPGMTGLQLLQKIKQKKPSPKVMMITAYGDAENYEQAIKLGADDFLTKPLDFNLLKEKLKALNN